MPVSLGESVGAYFEEGYQNGETLLLVARPAHSIAILKWLAAHGYPVDDMIASHQLTVLDAATTMGTLCRGGRPDPERFEAHGASLGAIAACPGPSSPHLRRDRRSLR